MTQPSKSIFSGLRIWYICFLVGCIGPVIYILTQYGSDWEPPTWLVYTLNITLFIVTAGVAISFLMLFKQLNRPGDKIMRLIRQKRFDEAVTLGKELYERHPKDPLVHINLVSAYYFNSQPRHALEVLQEKDPDGLPPRFVKLHEKWQNLISKTLERRNGGV